MGNLIQANLPCDICGSHDALAKYDTNSYCFSCGTSINKRNYASFREKKPTWNGKFPSDLTRNMSAPLKLWLKIYGLNKGDFLKANLAYSPYYKAVVIPFKKGDKFTGYQLRYVTGLSGAKSHNIGKLQPFYITHFPRSKSVVLVEDIRSALKLAKLTNCICLLGTRLTDSHRNDIIGMYRDISLWLDNDTAGQRAAKRMEKKFSVTSNVTNISTKLDPKSYTREEIAKYLTFGG